MVVNMLQTLSHMYHSHNINITCLGVDPFLYHFTFYICVSWFINWDGLMGIVNSLNCDLGFMEIGIGDSWIDV